MEDNHKVLQEEIVYKIISHFIIEQSKTIEATEDMRLYREQALNQKELEQDYDALLHEEE